MEQQSLQQRLESLESRLDDNRCPLAKFVANQDEATQGILNRLLEAPSETISHSLIAREIRTEPGHPGRGSIADHRNQRCKCYANG